MQRFSRLPIAPGWTISTLLLLGALAAPALATGSISGKVAVPASRAAAPVDSSGSDVSGSAALVNATNDKFQDFRVAVNADGTYKLDGLDPGTYTVVAVAEGSAPAIKPGVTVTDGQDTKLDLTLTEAQPFPIVKSAGGTPIPLTDDFYSASFADAPEIDLNQAWQLQNGLNGAIPLTAWKGPQEMSGKLKFKYSTAAIHLAADISFKTPGVNNWPDMGGQDIWDGNHIDFFFQNDAYDPMRTTYDKDHDWQVVLKLTDMPAFSIRQFGAEPDNQHPPQQNASIQNYVLRKVKADKSGELDRVDFPWAMFQQYGNNTGPISAPADNTLSAMDISLGAADPDMAPEDAHVKLRLSWSGFFEGWQHPNLLVPIKFVPHP
jgi:Carboxypeptidase regulatory-like domain